ncbi:hypothetical protein Glove_606g28 [Diversispora epigaea]|uniref:HMG box domain-containing protein n=1 Tax=Diversispora epigaea TaxID=1348612 RepID=A0A397GA18_9GLOM|nr:hypothetical protein Glove_606g28 [Diversispora epigaea]
MSEQSSTKDILFFQTYSVQQQNDTYDFIMEFGDKITNDGIKKSLRNAKQNQNIVGLIRVPFPPKFTVEDLMEPRNDKCGKAKVFNKFFIYRKWYTKCLTDHNVKNDQTSISPQIAKQWRNEPQEVKNYYDALSKRASELFIKKYGKEGIKSKNPMKIRKNKKKAKKITNNELSEIKPKIKEENLNSTATFEPPHQQQHQQHQSHQSNLSNNFPFSNVQSETLPLSFYQYQLLIDQSQQESSYQPSVSSFLQQSSESSYPSSESSSTSQSSEQSEMADTFYYYHTNTNNTMNHEINNIFDINTIYLDSGFTGFLENNIIYEGQVNDGSTEIFFHGGQVDK